MANVRTYDLHILFQNEGRDYARSYHNISRNAVKYFLEYYSKKPDFWTHVISMTLQARPYDGAMVACVEKVL